MPIPPTIKEMDAMLISINIIVRLVGNYPQSELVFAARLKQGELARKLNDFSGAQLVYEELINKPEPEKTKTGTN